MTTFEAEIADWARRVENAVETIFKEACQEVVSELNTLVPVETGFLRSSLMASTTAMPVMSQDNPGAGSFTPDMGAIELVIAGSEAGDVVYLGYVARYGAYVHFGANGRPGRPWVSMVAQRWPQIVATVSARVRSRLGL